ncbi:MAG: threonine synthase [Planctomycetota bacterium]|nr:threonine synthase [Planctomycetota bacterium]
MKYVSTRGQIEPVEFQDAVLMGLADDGGLIVPESIPDVTDRLEEWNSLSYPDLAFEVLRMFIDDIPAGDLKSLIEKTYASAFEPTPAVTVKVGSVYILELWHGPTLAFKDIALQLLGNLFEYILAKRGGRLNILGATSGDTGSAAISGCRGRVGIDIFVMHPAGRVSPIQQRQMTTVLDENVHNIAIAGSFDDCQRIMKTLAADLDFKRKCSLGAVNSVNWARVLAQIVYYFKAFFEVRSRTGAAQVRIEVPTGNFGDILAGWYARQMGLPISQLILATNENDILARFFNTGEYSAGRLTQTLSPSMDIQVASNFERYLYYRLGCDAYRLRGLMDEFARTGSLRVKVENVAANTATTAPKSVDSDIVAGVGTMNDVLATIRKYHRRYDYLLDPHTAVGVAVAERLGTEGDEPLICLSTAHPAKFPEAIKQATGKDLANHPTIDALADLPTRCVELPNSIEAVREFIVETVG